METDASMTEFCFEKYSRRSGTTDEGRDFENLVTANLALKLALDENVNDFEIKSNVDGQGAFDDVVFQVDKNDDTKYYCLQLKYKNNLKYLSDQEFSANSGNYALEKYCKDYHQICKKVNDRFTGILFARHRFNNDNKLFDFRDLFKYRIRPIDDTDETSILCKSLDEKCVCYQFIIENCNDYNDYNHTAINHYKPFFKNFVLCISSASTYNIKKNISETFEQKFFERSSFENFIKIIENFNKHCYNINKKNVKWGISLGLLDQYMIDLTFEQDLTASKLLLIQAILQNTVTHLKSISNFTDFGKNIKTQVTEEKKKKLSALFNFDNNIEEKIYSKTLFLDNKCPLIVNNNPTVQAVIRFSPDLKYILIDPNPVEIENVKNIKTLADVEQNCNHLYKDILETFQCRVQSKSISLKTLVELDLNVSKLITVDELFLMAHNMLDIGKVALELPTPHITPRRFSVNEHKTNDKRIVSETEIINEEEKIFIISAGPGMGKTTILKHFVYESNPKCWSLLLNANDLSEFLRIKNDNLLEKFENYIFEKQNKCLSEFEFSIFRLYFHKHAIRFLWDALDELNNENLENIKKLINQLQNEEMKHYITTRPHLTSDLEKNIKEMSSISLTLTEFDEDEQRFYVQNSLSLSEDQLIETFSKIKFNINTLDHNNILGIPLQIYMITELLKQKRISLEDLTDQLFTIDQLYEYFIDEKLNIFFKEKLKYDLNIDFNVKEIDKKKADYKKLFKQLSAQLHIRKERLEKCEVRYDSEMLQNIKNDGDPTGFIISLNQTSEHFAEAQFFHYSISEYFAALYLTENLKIVNILEKNRTYDNFIGNNVLFFFNLILVRDCKVHIAILYNNWSLFDECTDAQIKKVDKGGRNALQLLIFTSKPKYKFLDFMKKYIFILRDYDFQFNLNKLIKHRTQNITKLIANINVLSDRVDMLAKDTLFNLNTFDYIIEFKLFLFMGIIYAQNKSIPNHLFIEYQNDIITHCIMYDYCEVLNVLEELPNITFQFRKNRLDFKCALLYFKCSNWIQKLTFDSTILARFNFNFFQSFDENNWILIYQGMKCWYNNTLVAKQIYEIVKLLIRLRKTSILYKINSNGENMFFKACKLALTETVDLFLESGVDIELTNEEGETALHYACMCNANYILERSCSSKPNHCIIIESLLKNGALVNAKTHKQMTPLHYFSASCANLNVLQLFSTYNADFNAIDSTKSTILHYACRNQRLTIEMIKLIVKEGVFVNCQDIDNNTPLHFAVLHCKDEVISALIDNGANVNSINNNKATPLEYLLLNKYYYDEDTIRLLIENNAEMTFTNSNRKTVLHYVCTQSNTTSDLISFIIKNKVSVNCQDKDNNTPLHFAVQYCEIEVVRALIENGANVNSVNNNGKTPLKYVLKTEDFDKTSLLLKHNAMLKPISQSRIKKWFSCNCFRS